MRRVTALLLALAACNSPKHDPRPAASAAARAPSAHAVSHVPPPKAPLPPPPTGPVALTVDGKAAPLSVQVAYLGEDGVLSVVLADRKYSCDDLGARFIDDTQLRTLTLKVPPGPGATYFAGSRIGVTGQMDATGAPGGSYLDQNELTAQIASADTKTGGHVVGWTTWARGGWSAAGAFDAKVCPPLFTTPAPKLEASEPTGAVAGTMAGEAFTAKKALAVVRHNKKLDLEYVSEIDLFASADVGCADLPLGDKHDPSLAITEIGGASPKLDYSGTQQPMVGMFAPSTWKVGKPRTTERGWIRLESLDFAGPLKGTLRLAGGKGSAAGAFTADVCKKGSGA